MQDDRNGQPLNAYGDRLLPTTGRHGGDISSQRIDELDGACLDFVRELREKGIVPTAIDIGGGNGAQSRRMAELGAAVVLVDLTDQHDNISSFNQSIGHEAIRFYQDDIRTIDIASFSSFFHLIYSQRMMGCIRYDELGELFRALYRWAMIGARCFVSAGGLDTEVGQDYPHRNFPVADRWSPIAPKMASKHQIFAPQCLYRDKEFADLIFASGFSVVRRWTSPFGNPKVIAEKTKGHVTEGS
jgi:uncharacterized UPF0146 family protein